MSKDNEVIEILCGLLEMLWMSCTENNGTGHVHSLFDDFELDKIGEMQSKLEKLKEGKSEKS